MRDALVWRNLPPARVTVYRRKQAARPPGEGTRPTPP